MIEHEELIEKFKFKINVNYCWFVSIENKYEKLIIVDFSSQDAYNEKINKVQQMRLTEWLNIDYIVFTEFNKFFKFFTWYYII